MDKKKKIELIITGILVIIFVVALANSFKPRRRRRASAPSGQEKIKKSKKRKPELAVTFEKKKTKRANSKKLSQQRKRAEEEWGRDPFVQGSKGEVAGGVVLTLKGISLGKEKKYAFINNEIVTVGDTIAGYKVESIEKDRVFLKKGSEAFYLILPQE